MKNMKPHLHFDLNRWKGNVKVNTHACGSAEDLISMLSLGTVAVLRQTGISFDTYLEILVALRKTLCKRYSTKTALMLRFGTFCALISLGNPTSSRDRQYARP